MSQGFGIEAPRPHESGAHRQRSRYLVLIDCGGSTIARLFTEARELVADFDAGAEEVVALTHGRAAAPGADGGEWDHALDGNSADERRAAGVYTLDP